LLLVVLWFRARLRCNGRPSLRYCDPFHMGISECERAPADVVSTYKICTIRVGESSDSSRREPPPAADGSASGSGAGAQAPPPAPAKLPEEPEAVTALLETWLLMGALWLA